MEIDTIISIAGKVYGNGILSSKKLLFSIRAFVFYIFSFIFCATSSSTQDCLGCLGRVQGIMYFARGQTWVCFFSVLELYPIRFVLTISALNLNI